MSILSTNHRLISIGESYSAGNGIDITDQVISVTGDATPYSAGENIDIQDHIISGKDWSQDITDASSHAYNETTAWVQENYANSADMTYISAVVDTKLDASAWSTVSADYATESYVIMADNITYDRAKGYVDSQQFAKESACQSAFDYLNTNKLNTEDFTAWQNGQYATDIQTIEGQIANKYDTSSFAEVSGTFYTNDNPSGFITGVDLSPYYTTADANSLSSMLSGAIDYVSANADNVEVTNVVQSNSGVWNEVTNKLDTTSFSDVSGSFLTAINIPESANWEDATTAYQTNSASYITAHQDLSNYYTKDETSGKEELAQAFSDIPVGDPEVNAYVTDNSASLNGTTDLVQNSSGLWNDVAVYQSNSANYLTAHQDISYKLDTSSFTAWSAAQAENDYQLSAGTGIDLVDDDINKITRIDVTGDFGNPEVESYVQNNSATIDDVNTSYQTNSGTYLTAHQSLEGYAVESAFEYNNDDLITAYNGSAFAGQGGGGDVPTGTMNVTGLEYNAVNEISGYNGSAIAQYGAEKQWLVHDDTLVHAANSAQYALGVNLSAVAQLLGVDETVLYSGAYNGTITSYALNDNISSFEKIKVYGMTNDSDMLFTEFYTYPQPRYFSFFGTWSGSKLKTRCYVISNNTAFNNFGGVEVNLGSTTTGVHQHIGITKVIGIGRKS